MQPFRFHLNLLIAAADLQALDYMAKQHFSKEQLDAMCGQLSAYQLDRMPFNVPLMPGPTLPVKAWWQSIQNNTTATVIVTLAVRLYSIVPHAAATERSFSLMKWINAPRRASQTVGTLKRLSKVRTALDALVPKPT